MKKKTDLKPIWKDFSEEINHLKKKLNLIEINYFRLRCHLMCFLMHSMCDAIFKTQYSWSL